MTIHKRYVTIAGLIITLILAVIAVLASVLGWIDSTMPIWAAIGLHVTYVSIYYNKRIKAGSDGIEIGDKDADKPTD